MPDYNLEGLSSRSFEQLVQALASKVIGPGLVVFGDGPDGGREAVYEGLMSYPSEANPWSGYLVVQAKYRQRPEGRRKDSAWLLQQLRAELDKFTAKERGLRKPQYYLLCTNLVLTAKSKTGSKDRASETLQSSKRKLRLRGYDIWDYDRIRTFLDQFEDIRRAYAAWITPGDVLASVIRTLEHLTPEFEQTMMNFLEKECVSSALRHPAWEFTDFLPLSFGRVEPAC